MTQVESVDLPEPEPRVPIAGSDAPGPSSRPASPAAEPGLVALHATLDHVVEALGLRALTVVVDDPDLGRQAFRAGSGPFAPGVLAVGPGCYAEPTLSPERLDAGVLVALCAASLRVEVLRGEAPNAAGAVELALRRVPGVQDVTVERDGGLLLVTVHAGLHAPDNLARLAGHAAAPFAGDPLVVEIVHHTRAPALPAGPVVAADASPVPPVATAVPEAGVPEAPTAPLFSGSPPGDAPATTEPPAATPIAPASLLAVRSVPEAGEIEVHLRCGEARTIGRASMAEGLAGAVAATLDALAQHQQGVDLGLGWVRTIESTADRRFIVSVALGNPGTRVTHHGIGSGTSPIDAAARATLDAAARPDDTPAN